MSKKANESKKRIISNFIYYKSKYYWSKLFYIVLNILSFAISAIVIFLNLYALRYNPVESTKLIFIIITALSLFISFINTVYLLFNINDKKEKIKTKLEKIEEVNEGDLDDKERKRKVVKIYLTD